MQIKQQALTQQLQKKIAPCYVLTGEDNYLLAESLLAIKSAIKKLHEVDEKVISVQSPEDWLIVSEEANHYSLFAEIVLLTIFYDKKSIDAAGKKILTQYLTSINTRCFIIINAPNVPAKQMQWLAQNEQAVLVTIYPLGAEGVKNWITSQLKKNLIGVDPQVPELIHQYTQGNMLACAQVIEKLSLSYAPERYINTQQVLEHLSNQCQHSLFELVDACLLGESGKAIQILRHAANTKTEATLVLWILTQEIRALLGLHHLIQQKIEIKSACNQLKIWPQRISLYQLSIKRLNVSVLKQMLHYCQSIDEQIKSNLNTQVWNALERLAITLCSGQLLGDLCIA